MNSALEERKSCGIIGVSMLNSYFSKSNILRMAQSARDKYQRVFFMLPDKPAMHTLAGYGYSASEAQQTTQRKFRTLSNRCRSCIDQLELADAGILIWEQFESDGFYTKMLSDLEDLYFSDSSFSTDVRATTRSVYEGSGHQKKKELSLEEQVDAGLAFLLEELAFILSSPKVLNVEDTEYVYHKEMPILIELLAENYQFEPPKNVSFAVSDENF